MRHRLLFFSEVIAHDYRKVLLSNIGLNFAAADAVSFYLLNFGQTVQRKELLLISSNFAF